MRLGTISNLLFILCNDDLFCGGMLKHNFHAFNVNCVLHTSLHETILASI